ncbi:hypothetical protein AAKU55_003318 [Oxalobacteraceae bacterium GrIS 1.11]
MLLPIGRARPLASLLACGLLASCAGLIGPRQLEVPLARLQQGLERRFPVENKLLNVFDVSLSRPQLSLLPESDRVALTMAATVSPPFNQLLGQSWHGTVALSGHLVLDARRNAVFISDARIDRLAADGVDPALQRQFAKLASLFTDQAVKDIPVYSFRAEDLRYAGVQFMPTAITSTPNALVLTFEALK